MDKSDIEDILTGIVTPVDWSNNKDLQMAYIVARDVAKAAIDAYKAKLAEQKPIGYLHANGISFLSSRRTTAEQARAEDYNTPLYAHPCVSQNGRFEKHESQIPDGTLINEGTKGQHRSIENHILDVGEMIEHESHSLEFEVRTMVEMLEAKEWAEHCGKSDLGQRLEWAITSLHNEAQIIPDGWQPIETAPRGMVLLFCDASMPEHPVYYAGLVIRNRECIDTTQTIGFMATHWMQMPETPKYIRSEK